jgi:hypothetical protein
MKLLLTITGVLLLTQFSIAQSLKKYPISNTGCTAYMYCQPDKWDIDLSEDSSKVVMGECKKDDVHYGIICIKLLAPVNDLNAAEELLIAYVDYLKLNFEIKKAAGYGKGLILNNNENTRGIVDYWEDKEKNSWKMKAWTNGKFIGVMYGFSKKELPETKLDLFLNGFRFPE